MKFIIKKTGMRDDEYLVGNDRFSKELGRARRFESWLAAKRFMETIKKGGATSGKTEVISVSK